MGFEHLIDVIQNGEPVDAGVTNRPINQLVGNTEYLYSLLQAAATGQALFRYGVTVEAEAAIGMPVWYNGNTQRFERGLAAVQTDPATGFWSMANSSRVWGVVCNKTNSTLADLLVLGSAPLNLAASAGVANPPAGTYYLSGTNPGMLVAQKVPVSVPVLQSDGSGNVLFVPTFRDLFQDHVHYRFELQCQPAGTVTPPSLNAIHTISDADPTLRGWLPADHASFNGKAPEGAHFGYNLAAHADLQNLWPPLPTSGAWLEFDRGTDPLAGFQGTSQGTGHLVVIDRNGIWWMSNCYGDVPWPTDYTSPISMDSADSAGSVCPRDAWMRLMLFFSRPNFETDKTAVTQLNTKSSRLVITCADTNTPSNAGPLDIDLNLNLLDGPTGELGSTVLKSFDSQEGSFGTGSVVEGLLSGASNVVLSSATTRHLTPSDTGTPVVYQGLVTINVTPSSTYELPLELVRLSAGVTEETLYTASSNLPYLTFLGMAAGRVSAFLGKIYIPESQPFVTPVLRIRISVLGRVNGTLPNLSLAYCRLPRSSPALTPVSIPTALTAGTLVTAAAVSANQYIENVSDSFAVAAGDTVFFTITRNGPDGYSGQVGALQLMGILQET